MLVSDKGNLIFTPIDLSPFYCEKMGFKEDLKYGIIGFKRIGKRLEEPAFHHFTRDANISAWFALQFGTEVKYRDSEMDELINVGGSPFCGLMNVSGNPFVD